MKSNFQPADRTLLEYILKLTEEQLHNLLQAYLEKYYKEVVSTEDYLYAKGTIPIALVAHLDTVFEKKPSLIFYDDIHEVMWSPNGLGADDRAGIFSIIKIISHGFRPHIIFTHDEEYGGIGAEELAKKSCPFKNLRYIIELDRQGADDCVFYNCINEEFCSYVESFGFKFDHGTFTDISFLCPKWNIAGVNLSIGYINEHSPMEHLFCGAMMTTIEKVENMLSEDDIPKFKYIPSKSAKKESGSAVCDCCHKVFDVSLGIRIEQNNGSKFYCDECLPKLCWCDRCGAPYEFDEKGGHSLYCPNCYNDMSGGLVPYDNAWY